MTAGEFPARVVASRVEGPGAKTLTLSVPEDFTFIPGQWAMFKFADGSLKPSAYSLASSPLKKGEIELGLRTVGEFSERLCAAAPGQELFMKGPYGKWLFDATAEHSVLVCEGTGLAPYRSFARYVRDAKLKSRLTFVYAEPHLLDTDELVRAGFPVHKALSALDGLKDKSAHFYFCGARSLVQGVGGPMREQGFTVHTENWADYKWDSF